MRQVRISSTISALLITHKQVLRWVSGLQLRLGVCSSRPSLFPGTLQDWTALADEAKAQLQQLSLGDVSGLLGGD